MTGPALATARSSTLRRVARRGAWDLAAAVALLAAPLAVAFLGTRGPARVTLNLGPNDAAYLSGFKPEVEIDGERGLRWSRHEASIRLPLWARGSDVELAFLFERIVAQDARVRVLVGRRVVDSFPCRAKDGPQIHRVRFAASERTPLVVGLSVDADDRRDLGLRLDWISAGVAPGARLGVDDATALRLGLLITVLFLLFRIAGFGTRGAAGLLAPLAIGLAAWVWRDPLTVAHLALKLSLGAVLVAALALVLLRRQPGARWALVAATLVFLLKGVGVFHPHFFYPDVQVHRRFVYELRAAQGTLAERGREAQRKLHQAYRVVDGQRGYNFPYSPLFYAPFTYVRWAGPESVDDAMRTAALFTAAGEVLLVFWLGRMLVGPGAGALAGLLVGLLPISFSRLLYAMWPMVVGHFLDLLVIVFAAACLRAPGRHWRWLALAAAACAACLMYVGSLFTVSLFLLALAVCARRGAARLVGIAVLAGVVTVATLYLPFVNVLLHEILPAVWRGGALTGSAPESAGAVSALARVPMFYGWAYPLLSVAGLALVRRRRNQPAWQLLLAGFVTYVALLALRALPSGLFRDVKESTFVAPFVALATAVALVELGARVRHGRWAAAMIVAGLAVFGLSAYAGYFVEYSSAAALPPRDAGPAPGAAP